MVNLQGYIRRGVLASSCIIHLYAMNPCSSSSHEASQALSIDKAFIRKHEMPKMLKAIEKNDLHQLQICAEKLIWADEQETMEMALAAAILCNKLPIIQHLVEIGYSDKRANVAQAIVLLVDAGGQEWYTTHRIEPTIIIYLLAHLPSV